MVSLEFALVLLIGVGVLGLVVTWMLVSEADKRREDKERRDSYIRNKIKEEVDVELNERRSQESGQNGNVTNIR